MEKNPLIILHGWGVRGDNYKMTKAFLKEKGFKVYSPDLPGFGENKILGSAFTLSDYVIFLAEFYRKHNIKKATLICHSFGGRIGLKFSALYRDKVDKLILSGVPGLPPVFKLKVQFFYIVSKIGKYVISFLPSQKFYGYGAKLLYYLSGARDYSRTEGLLRETFKNVIGEDLVRQMRSITIPVYLIWGQEDAIVPINIAGKMQRLISGSQLIALKGSHKLPYENPQAFNRILQNLLCH